jgi:geranylgeranyl diphosphate synthase, type II
MDAQEYLAACLPRVDRALDEVLPRADAPPERLHAAMRHLIFPGGKRLRPALALAAAEAVGGATDAAMPAAIAVELVHVYSLVHDDLPCMDDDVERRGRPTVHVAFDEATAVLAGDALLTAAFGALVDGATERDAAARILAVRDLAHAAGAAGLVGGQVDDLASASFAQRAEGERSPSSAFNSAAAVESVHARKSAALIAASITTGARLAGAGETLLAQLHAAGIATGVAFQITDDLLDAEDDEGCSLVRVIGEPAARERAQALLDSALAELAELGPRAEPLRALLRYAVQRKL